jgi:2-oxoglutarate dehydrogenase complex dehydrogenase (E1) component-like enzyme
MENIVPDGGIPLWVVILIAIFGAIGTFWTKISGTVEKFNTSKTEVELKKLSNFEAENLQLIDRIRRLEGFEKELKVKLYAQERTSIKLTSALTTLVPIMKKIMEENPQYDFLIEHLETIISENQ